MAQPDDSVSVAPPETEQAALSLVTPESPTDEREDEPEAEPIEYDESHDDMVDRSEPSIPEISITHNDGPADGDERDLPSLPNGEDVSQIRRSESAMSGVFESVSLDERPRQATTAPAPTPKSAPVVEAVQSSTVRPPSDSESSVASPPASRHRSGTLPNQADGRPPLLSGVLIGGSLETLAYSKEALKSPAIREASEKALAVLRAGTIDSETMRTVFEPLRLACETKSYPLVIAALDCIGKLTSHASSAAAAASAPSSDASSRRSSVDLNVSAEAAGPVLASDPILADEIVNTVCACFIESTGSSLPSTGSSSSAAAQASTGPEAVNLHILSALLALILSSALPVHQSSLLKAVRTVYNIFLLSRGHQNQMVAQAALGQIVSAVSGRVKLGGPVPERSGETDEASAATDSVRNSARSSVADLNDLETPTVEKAVTGLGLEGAEPTTRPRSGTVTAAGDTTVVESAPTTDSLEADNAPTDTVRLDATPKPAAPAQLNGHAESVEAAPTSLRAMESRRSFDGEEGSTTDKNAPPLSEDELLVKDAFLVFRTLCKLSMKPLGSESERDNRSQPMRSKLLALQLILTVLHLNMPLFNDPSVLIYSSSSRERTTFVHAIKQYLCLSISRNAVSSVINVFELSCEIFWRVLSGMRSKLKKEIEVLLNEIFLPILEIRNSTVRQKSILLGVMGRLCHDPQALVEIYINYDCDRASLENVYERLMNIVSKMGTTQYTTTTLPPATGAEPSLVLPDGTPTFVTSGSTPGQQQPSPSPSSAAPSDHTIFAPHVPYEVRLKRQALESLVAVLRSLVDWAGRAPTIAPTTSSGPTSVALGPNDSTTSLGGSSRVSEDAGSRGTTLSSSMSSQPSSSHHISGSTTPEPSDDPSRFENAKQRKTTLLEGIRKFNFKPKRGISFLVDQGFIKSRSPTDIARFLLYTDGLNKAMIGEYLGEGDEENIATMHAFVDQMDFTNARFVDAVRSFLQSFRLPGEAQKIDRFMLKFADRYVAGNPTAFATADTAYVLAYSVIMLNTDLYNPQNKKRMTKPQFLKNNSGIDEGKDLPEALLSDIYDEISTNEIRMKDEIELPTGPAASSGIASALSNVGRDFQREAYVLQSEGMVSKTEALFRNMIRSQRRGGQTGSGGQFFAASSFEHVRPMFTTAWMPILAGLSDPLQESDDIEIIQLSLEGFKQAITIVCLFDLELERNAFVTTLAKFTFLNNMSEMRPKNVEAIKTLLGIASVNGNYLKSSWKEIITCVSQLERMQLLSQGVDPTPVRKPTSSRSGSSRSKLNRPTEEVANATQSRHITIAADRIFSASNSLSGTAIVDFVRALSEVSWEEIQASGLTDQPRTFCLQKLVESSYYNMDRIRLEWSNIWSIMGEHLNQVCCHSNVKVSFFALDSLRQMASHFLEKEELANFKFQKDFLRPFEYAMVHNKSIDVRDMILQCFKQLIQARVANLRSGWRTMFGVFSAAAKVLNERVAAQAFEIVKTLNRDHFGEIVIHGAFADLAVCITDFCKISLYQKISLHAIEMLKGLIPQMLRSPDCPVMADAAVPVTANGNAEYSHPTEDVYKWWFPVLFGFYDVIMNGEDLEVRKRALDYLFDTLTTHGKSFTPDFWNQIAKEVLFPIFAVLRSRADVSRFSTHEDMSVWLSTTMIQALRNLVDLFSFYFDVLSRMLDRLLDLLCECICQENDTLARIGTACLQQLLEKNVRKLSPDLWERIVTTFITLFHTTTATQLFDVRLRLPYATTGETPTEENGPATGGGFAPLSPGIDSENKQLGDSGEVEELAPTPMPSTERKRAFRQIIVKCVLQLLLIETAHELLQNEEVYTTIPPVELLKLMGVLDESYRFAKKFNADKELRMALWQVGFMKQLPNLLKQESSSAATLVSVLLRMYSDQRPDHLAKRSETVDAFLPLALDIVAGYISLEAETQARNIAAWMPVVAEVLTGFCSFEDTTNTKLIYPLAVDLLARELTVEVRGSLRGLLYRIGIANGLLDVDAASETDGQESAQAVVGQSQY